jgi:DsbC/DsbD-like thiol-disulfide interchange protein
MMLLKTRNLITTFCLIGALAVAPALAQSSVTAAHVTVSLVSENASLPPGKSSWVGVRFQLEQGWHVYWINPGDSGEPPKVDWKFPAGFKAGELQFPAPHRLPLQTLMNFGYEDDVLYPLSIQVPAGATGSAVLTANVRWMICKDTCIPGKGTLALTLPVAAKPPVPSAQQALFKETLPRIPRKLDPGWIDRATLSGSAITLTLSRLMDPSGGPKTAEFFPFDDLVIENAAPQTLSLKPRVFELRLKKSDQMSKPPARLRGVVVVNGRHARVVDTPLLPASK